MKTIVIGDIHGCYDLLDETIERAAGSNAELVFLGDLFDRAPMIDGDIKVLTRVRDLQDNPEKYGLSNVVVLRGNHEQLLLDAYATGDTDLWEYNGGSPVLLNYLKDNPQHIDWLRKLPYYVIRGNYLLVHAGVRPGVPLEEQSDFDLVWYRPSEYEPYQPHGLPFTVIHGHTIQDPPFITHRCDSIAIDTGAFYTGVLSSICIEYND